MVDWTFVNSHSMIPCFPLMPHVWLSYHLFQVLLYSNICSFLDTPKFRFLLPATLIVINDIAAYIFGFFFGKTPLIKLSPKKTWEGFIGASVTTIISAFVVSILYIYIYILIIMTLLPSSFYQNHLRWNLDTTLLYTRICLCFK